jgi:hypothetical protein
VDVGSILSTSTADNRVRVIIRSACRCATAVEITKGLSNRSKAAASNNYIGSMRVIRTLPLALKVDTVGVPRTFSASICVYVS